MKGKKMWAIVLTICLIVSSIGVFTVIADQTNIKSDIADVVLSVTADQTDVKPGDTVTLTVSIDRFHSSLTDDVDKYVSEADMTIEGKSINTMENHLNLGNASYVSGSIVKGMYKPVYSKSDNTVGLALVKYGENGDVDYIQETDSPVVLYSVKVVIPESETENTKYTFGFTDKLIMKSMCSNSEYTVDTNSAVVNVWAKAPVISLNNAEPVSVYTSSVEINAVDVINATVNGETKTLPYTVNARGEYTVSAENPAGSVTKTFKIEPTVTSVSIKSNPTTTEYVKGSTLDLTGGVITAALSNGEAEDVSMTDSKVSAEGFDSAKVGTQTVTVTYEGKSAAFEVNVKDKAVTAVEWVENPAAEIIEGQDLSVALGNAKIKVTYDNGETENVPVTEAMCSDYVSDKTGKQTVTVTYGGKTLTFDITVNEKQLTGITVKTVPAKTEYVEGTGLDITGGVITAAYDNGKTEDVDMTTEMISGFDNTKLGKQTITVTYGTKTTTFEVTVKEKTLEKIDVTTAPSKMTVIEGQDLDVTDGVLTVTYDNGTTKTVNMTNSMITEYDKTKVGTQTVTVSYTENGVTKTTTLDVTVQEKSIVKVELVSAPDKTTVLEGKEIDLTGAKIRVTYDNGTVDENVEVTSDMISGFDNSQIGSQNISVKYKGVTADVTFEVTVQAKSVREIAVTTTPKTEYIEGNEFTSEGGKITVFYDNDTTKIVDFSADSVVVTSADTSVPGSNKEVTVTYTENGKVYTAKYKINVAEKTLVSIAVTKLPGKLSIIEGQNLDVTDGEITLTYDNGQTPVVAMTNDMISGFDKNLVGTQEVTVSYNGKTTTISVVVAAKTVSEVQLVSLPTATNVTEGLKFDLAGGKIKVIYDNGTSEEMDMEAGMLTLDTNTVGKQTATITYAGKTVTTFEVEVLAKKPVKISANLTEAEVVRGTAFAKTGFEVYLEYNNDTKDVLNLEDVVISGFDSEKLGKQEVTVSYQEFEPVVLSVVVLENSEIDVTADLDKPYTATTSDGKSVSITSETVYMVTVNVIKTDVLKAVEKCVNTVTEQLAKTEKVEKYKVLDIKLLIKETGDVIQKVGEKIPARIQIPEGYDKNKVLTVYRLDEENNTLIALETKVDGNDLVFYTDHFSTYVIVQSEKLAEETTVETTTAAQKDETTTSGETSVKTGDSTNVIAILGIIALAGAGFVVVSRKREQM